MNSHQTNRRRTGIVALCALTTTLVIAVALMAADRADAFSYNYCSGVYLSGGSSCGDGSYLARTYDAGTASNGSEVICVKMVTAAGNIRGGGRTPCGGGSINLCLNSATPNSQAYVVAWGGNNITAWGYTDNSPNHSPPCY